MPERGAPDRFMAGGVAQRRAAAAAHCALPAFLPCVHARLCVCQGPHATLPVLCPCSAHCSNAGTNAYRVGPLASQDPSDIIAICETNVIGTMLGALRSCCSHTAVLSSDP